MDDNERQRVLAAAHDELVRWGIDRFSVPAMAHRHGLDYGSILQHWGGRPDALILDVLTQWPAGQMTAPDSGNVRTDLYRLALGMASYVASTPGRQLQSAHLIADADLLTVAIRRMAWQARAGNVRVVLDRARARGELREGVDVLAALELLFAPINMRALFTGEPIDDEYCHTVAELVWRAVTSS